MRPLQAHCHRGLGTLYATIGQHEQARTELSAAIGLYHAMDMRFWLPRRKRCWRRWKREWTRGDTTSRGDRPCYTGGKEVIMSMYKEEVLELVRQLPDEVDVKEVIYRLYLREKLAVVWCTV
jgi:hypothetical protein